MIIDKFITRKIQSQLEDSLSKDYITVLIGPRQVGKSTLLEKLIKSLEKKKIFQFNFDDVFLRSQIKKDFYFLQKEIEGSLGNSIAEEILKIYVFIDEVQKMPEIFEWVKMVFDKHRRKVKFVLTGSSSLEIRTKLAETMAGRARYFYLFPLTLNEIISWKFKSSFGNLLEILFKADQKKISKLIAPLFSKREKIKSFLEEKLFYGGLPNIWITKEKKEKIFALDNFIQTYLARDIKEISRVGIENYNLTLEAIINFSGGILNFSSLSQDLGFTRITLKSHFELMKKTMIFYPIYPFILKQKRIKSPKIYFFDAGVLIRFYKFNQFSQLKTTGLLGKILEHQVILDIIASTKNWINSLDYYFWRDYENHEIDLILKRGLDILPIEITSANRIERNKLLNFSAFFKKFNKVKRGILFYNGDEIKKIKIENKEILILPLWIQAFF